MMSGADFDAMQEQERQSKRKADVDAALGRCDQAHPNKITPERFKAVCDELFRHETLGKVIAAYSMQAIGDAVAEGKMTVLDALYECLKHTNYLKQHRIFLISKLFDMDVKDDKDKIALGNQFVLAFNTRDRIQQGPAFYTEALKRATPEKFTNAIKSIDKALLPNGYQEIYSDLSCIDVLDVLSKCLKLSDEHAQFKFLLVSKLFNLPKEDDQESRAIVDGFVEAVKKQPDSKTLFLNEIIERIKKMSKQEFFEVCEATDKARSYINGKKTKEIITPEGLGGMGWILPPVLPSYLIAKNVKAAIRGISSSAIESQITRERLGVFDAVYELLSSNIGQDSSRSFKFCFILAICGFVFKDKDYIVPNTNLGKYLNQLKRREGTLKLGGASGIKNEGPSQLVQDLIQAMRAIKESSNTSMYESIQAYVQQCYTGTVSRKDFIDALKAVRAVRDKELEDAGSTVLGSLSIFVKSAKTASRNKDFDTVITKLEAKEITVLDALNNILNGTGETGPHSLKYALLKELFKDLNKDIVVTAVESGATINLFIQAIKEFKKSSLKGMPLEEKSGTAPTI